MGRQGRATMMLRGDGLHPRRPGFARRGSHFCSEPGQATPRTAMARIVISSHELVTIAIGSSEIEISPHFILSDLRQSISSFWWAEAEWHVPAWVLYLV